MKVLVLHSRYLSGHLSGENRVIDDDIEVLRRGGHEVVSWTPSLDPGRKALLAGIDAVWSGSAMTAVKALIGQARPDIVYVGSLYPALSPVILRASREEDIPTVLRIPNFRLACLPATLLRDGKPCEDCLGKIPWRGVVHGCYRGSRAASAALAFSLTVHRQLGTFGCVTTFVTVTDFVRRKLAEAGLDSRRMRTRGNFAWPTEHRMDPGDYFVYLGRLSVEKGVDTVTSTWEGNHRLLVVGNGPEEARLRASARPGVEFRPAVPPDRLVDLLRHARALLLPSRWHETFGRVAVEAFAAGVPVIASRIGGLPEVVTNGVSGLLVAPDRPADWVEAVRRLDDDVESMRLGAGALQSWTERFSPEVGLRTLEELYAWTLECHDADRHESMTAKA